MDIHIHGKPEDNTRILWHRWW